jgi:hypothetical protein
MIDVILKKFEAPDEVRTFDRGKFELVHIGGLTIGRATYAPGWKWSEHVGKGLGKDELRRRTHRNRGFRESNGGDG